MNVAQLIESLKLKDQEAEVEFLVCKTNGEIVCANIETKAGEMKKILKLFSE